MEDQALSKLDTPLDRLNIDEDYQSRQQIRQRRTVPFESRLASLRATYELYLVGQRRRSRRVIPVEDFPLA